MNHMTYNDKDMNIVAQAMREVNAERTLRIEAEEQLAALEGKVRYADAMAVCQDSILVSDMALILKQSGVQTGEERFYKWLRLHGYVYRQPSGQNLPTQRSLELGIMEVKHVPKTNAYGRKEVRRTTMITAKGRSYFYDKIMAEKDAINAMEAEKKAEKRKRDAAARKAKRHRAS